MQKNRLLEAIDDAENGRWSEAHAIVQGLDDDRTASWIHAVLHKIEGDLGNSAWWYRLAGQAGPGDEKPMDELARIRQSLLGT